ncbi:MAG: pyruvate kinase, partial [Phycisphaeraceae bacterium]
YLALSFVRRGGDLTRLRELLAAEGRKDLPIVAKLETPQALDDLEAVVEEADALMVARGDLGVEMDLAEVPVWQKRIIRQAHDFGKPVIVATQMLQSMIEQAGPTRAEVSDVANAVLDGADALMLSGETAIGAYAVQSVQVMTRSTRVAEAEAFRLRSGEPRPPANLRHRRYRSAALAHGVSVVVEDLEARYVVVWTEHGGGARYLSQNRLAVPIIALSQSVPALRQMGLNFGVYPVYMDRPESAAQLLERADCLMLDSGWAERGDAIVAALGEPLGTAGVTNEIRVHYVGDACRR